MSWLCIIQSKQCHQFVVGAIVSHLVLTTGMQGNCGSFLRHMVVNGIYLPVFGNTAINAAIFSHIQICLLVPTDCQKKLIQCQQHTVKMEEETVPKSLADNFILTHKTQMQFFISWYLLRTAWAKYSSMRASRTTFGLLLCTTGVHHWWSHSRS